MVPFQERVGVEPAGPKLVELFEFDEPLELFALLPFVPLEQPTTDSMLAAATVIAPILNKYCFTTNCPLVRLF